VFASEGVQGLDGSVFETGYLGCGVERVGGSVGEESAVGGCFGVSAFDMCISVSRFILGRGRGGKYHSVQWLQSMLVVLLVVPLSQPILSYLGGCRQ
jgi:hypothetical protein